MHNTTRVPEFAPRSASFAAAAAAVLFGTSGVAVRLFAPGLPAVTTAGWRVVFGGMALAAVSAARQEAPWRYPLRWRVTAPGALALLGFQVGFFWAVNVLGVATATVVTIGAGPVGAGLLDLVRRRVTSLTTRWWTGVAVAVAGIALTVGAGAVTINPVGLAAALFAGCCFPLFGSAIRDLSDDRPAMTAAATVFGTAAIGAAALLAITGSNPATSTGTVLVLIYLGVITTALAYALWSASLPHLGLTGTVTMTMLEPVAATALAIGVLGEPMHTTTIAGAALTLLGMRTATTRRGAAAAGVPMFPRSRGNSPGRAG